MAVMASRMLTRADLNALPEDGLRHELIDGAIVMSPAPNTAHQRFAFALARALHAAASGSSLEVLLAPYDVILGPHVVEPDILIAPRADFTARELPTAPLLVVEVRSPTTAWVDEGRKLTIYEEAGVRHYWLADPEGPTITVLDLVDGRYHQAAQAMADATLTVRRPFPLTVSPGRLARGE